MNVLCVTCSVYSIYDLIMIFSIFYSFTRLIIIFSNFIAYTDDYLINCLFCVSKLKFVCIYHVFEYLKKEILKFKRTSPELLICNFQNTISISI